MWINSRVCDELLIDYHIPTITTCGLYLLNPLFDSKKRLFKGLFSRNSCHVVSIQERVMIVRVQYIMTDYCSISILYLFSNYHSFISCIDSCPFSDAVRYIISTPSFLIGWSTSQFSMMNRHIFKCPWTTAEYRVSNS